MVPILAKSFGFGMIADYEKAISLIDKTMSVLFDSHWDDVHLVAKSSSSRVKKGLQVKGRGKRKRTIFGKQVQSRTKCVDPNHDPTKSYSMGQKYSSMSYGRIISPVCKVCYDCNRASAHFHILG